MWATNLLAGETFHCKKKVILHRYIIMLAYRKLYCLIEVASSLVDKYIDTL